MKEKKVGLLKGKKKEKQNIYSGVGKVDRSSCCSNKQTWTGLNQIKKIIFCCVVYA